MAAAAAAQQRRAGGTASRRGGHLREVRAQGGPAKNVMPRNKQLAAMPADFAMCRVGLGNHVPEPGTFRIDPAPGGGWTQSFTCACGTEVTKERDRYGFRLGVRYNYPPGYLMEEGGGLSADERAALFVSLAGGRRRR